MQKVGIRSQGWTILATTLSGDQIITSVAPSGSPATFCPGQSGGPKFTMVLSIKCCSALHITLTGGLADTVRDWGNLLNLIQDSKVKE